MEVTNQTNVDLKGAYNPSLFRFRSMAWMTIDLGWGVGMYGRWALEQECVKNFTMALTEQQGQCPNFAAERFPDSSPNNNGTNNLSLLDMTLTSIPAGGSVGVEPHLAAGDLSTIQNIINMIFDSVLDNINEFTQVVGPLVSMHQGLCAAVQRVPATLSPTQKLVHLIQIMYSRGSSEANGEEPLGVYFGPTVDNFDTGNSYGPPIPEFQDEFVRQTQNPESYRRYSPFNIGSPKPINDGILSIISKAGFLQTDDHSQFCVHLGGGTTNLWDSLCRLTLLRRGDIVLVPTVTFGLFLPQINAMGGVVHFIHPLKENDYKITPEQVEDEIIKANTKSVENFLLDFEFVFNAFIIRLCNDAILTLNESKWAKGEGLEEIKGFKQSLVGKSFVEISDQIYKFIGEEVLEKNVNFIKHFQVNYRLRAPIPNRVATILHVNPTVWGSMYLTQFDVVVLAPVFEKYKVAVVEDFAYAFLWINKTKIPYSFLPHVSETYMLLGLSKPFSLANLRVGAVIGRRTSQVLEKLPFLTQVSVGFFNTMIEDAMIKLVESPYEKISQFLDENAFNETNGYVIRRDTLIACLEGLAISRNLSGNKKIVCKRIIAKELDNFFEHFSKKENYLVTLNLSTFNKENAVNDMLENGLNKFFEITFFPEAGFFLIVDCSKLIAYSQAFSWKCSSSVEVFVLLFNFFGIKNIPVESMGGYMNKNVYLRFSYSCSINVIVWHLFALKIGIKALEDQNI